MINQTLTAVAGILVGHATSREHGTGCTAVLCPEGFTPGLAVPGFAPGSRETELMRPESLVDAVHGILLTGGSAFGLGAADGVVRYLRERGHGFVMPHASIPIVPAAVIYDLDGNTAPGVLPNAAMGYAAAAGASADPVEIGDIGAGTGARCGRMFMAGGPERTAPAGVGSWCVAYRGIRVGVLAVVNPLGNIHDPDTGEFLAGARAGGDSRRVGRGGPAAFQHGTGGRGDQRSPGQGPDLSSCPHGRRRSCASDSPGPFGL